MTQTEGQVGYLKKLRVIHPPKLRWLPRSTKAVGQGLEFKQQHEGAQK